MMIKINELISIQDNYFIGFDKWSKFRSTAKKTWRIAILNLK